MAETATAQRHPREGLSSGRPTGGPSSGKVYGKKPREQEDPRQGKV